MRLLVTRPDPDGQRTAATLVGRGHHPVRAPLLRIEALAANLGEGPWSGVLMTSANAARAIAAHASGPALRQLPAFVVGSRSAAAACEAGFSRVTSADGNVDDLARLVALRFATDPQAKLLYLCGQDRSGDLVDAARRAGIRVHSVEVYRSVAVQQFPIEVAVALLTGEIDGVLHYSRRTAEAYCSCARAMADLKAALRPTQYCLSAQVAAPLVAAGAPQVLLAPHPDEGTLMGLVGA
jgi:uroporphyrinogen-III synthase